MVYQFRQGVFKLSLVVLFLFSKVLFMLELTCDFYFFLSRKFLKPKVPEIVFYHVDTSDSCDIKRYLTVQLYQIFVSLV